jgi:hypothetical protein
MKIFRSTLLLLAMATVLSSCYPGASVSTGNGQVTSNGERITLKADGHPVAQITKGGDFSVDGKTQAVTPEQRLLLQTYHREMNGMTSDGIAIGKQGAALAGTAVTEAIKGAINGNGDQIDAKVEAEAEKIEQRALQLCKRLVVVKATQDSLAAQLPAFVPYATIATGDVKDCDSDVKNRGNEGEALTQAHAGNAAEQADAAATAADR